MMLFLCSGILACVAIGSRLLAHNEWRSGALWFAVALLFAVATHV